MRYDYLLFHRVISVKNSGGFYEGASNNKETFSIATASLQERRATDHSLGSSSIDRHRALASVTMA